MDAQHHHGHDHHAPPHPEPPAEPGYPHHPETPRPAGELPGSPHAHKVTHPPAPDAGAHDAHGNHEGHGGHGGHDKHAGHSVEMFRRKFWLTLLLTIPVVAILALVLAKPELGEIPMPGWLAEPRGMTFARPSDAPDELISRESHG